MIYAMWYIALINHNSYNSLMAFLCFCNYSAPASVYIALTDISILYNFSINQEKYCAE